MVKSFIFIEDGSLDTENLRKIMDNSGNADVKFITYRQGAAKPELVSIENNEPVKNMSAYRKEIIEMHRNVVLKALETFINDKVERHVETDFDHFYQKGVYHHKLIYRGDTDDFTKQFEHFLKHEYDGSNLDE